jgi:hypothetical protein
MDHAILHGKPFGIPLIIALDLKVMREVIVAAIATYLQYEYRAML